MMSCLHNEEEEEEEEGDEAKSGREWTQQHSTAQRTHHNWIRFPFPVAFRSSKKCP